MKTMLGSRRAERRAHKAATEAARNMAPSVRSKRATAASFRRWKRFEERRQEIRSGRSGYGSAAYRREALARAERKAVRRAR